MKVDLAKLANLEDVSIDKNAKTKKGEKAKEIFCNGWPATKVTLEGLTLLIKNPIVKIVITIVVSAGDALHGKICQ